MAHEDDEEKRRKDREREEFRKQQERASEKGRAANTKGTDFHRGMAQQRGETPERGWAAEHPERTPYPTNRRLDQARVVEPRNREFTEYKSGRVDDKSLEQIRADRYLLETGRYRSGSWVTVQGEQISKEVRAELEAMRRDFGNRFTHKEVSREEAKRAIELGQQLAREQNRTQAQQLELITPELLLEQQQQAKEKRKRDQALELGQQLELPGVGETAGQQAARQQDNDRIERERIAHEAAERIARRFQPIIQEIGRPPPAPELDPAERAARDVADRQARAQRELDERNARTMQRGATYYAQQAARYPELADTFNNLLGSQPPPGVELEGLPTAPSPELARKDDQERERLRELGVDKGPR